MAVLTFISSTSYKLASVGDVESVSMGSVIFVAGFPLPSEAVNARILRLLKGDVIAYANAVIANGYQLLYSNPTLPGMSGGAVLSSQGKLVGIHGQGETDIKLSELKGVAVKTGSNQAVPITYYLEMSTLAPQMDSMALSPARSSDSMPVILPREHKSVPAISGVIAPVGFRNIQDALALAVSMLALNDYDSTIKQTSEILAYRYTWFAFYLRAASKFANRDSDGAFADVERSLAARGDYAPSYDLRSHIRESLGLKSFACNDLVLANSYGSRSAGKRLSEICLSFQYPSSFFSENGSHAFFAKASSRYVNIGTTGSWNSSVTPILVKIVSVSHPLIVLEEKSRMNSIEDTLQTTRVDINCAKFWSEPSALLYNDIPGSKNVIPYLYKYFCKKPG